MKHSNAGSPMFYTQICYKKMLNKKHLIIFIVSLLLAHDVFAGFSASVNRSELALGETLELQLIFEGDNQGKVPDIDKLRHNFELKRAYPSSSRNTINGHTTYINQWTIQLEPKHKGKLLIPPFTLVGETTSPIEITVHEQSQAPSTLENLMIETIVDKGSAYVQEQLKLSYRLYYKVSVNDINAEELKLNDAVVKQLESKRYQRTIDGQHYQVIEINYAILPQRSGTLVIPPLDWQIDVLQGGRSRALFGSFSRTQAYKLRSGEKVIRIRSIPDEFPADAQWLPARSVELSQRWSSSPLEFKLGTPITREISLKVSGLESAQLPHILEDSSSAEQKVYLEQPNLEDAEDQFGLVSTRKESAAIVLNSERSKVAGISVPWWNTVTNELEYASLPEQSIALSPGQEVKQTEVQASRLSNQQAPARNVDTLASGPSKLLIGILTLSALLNIVLAFVVVKLYSQQKTPIFRKKTKTQSKVNQLTLDLAALKSLAESKSASEFRVELARQVREVYRCSNLQEFYSYLRAQGALELLQKLESLDDLLYANTKAEMHENILEELVSLLAEIKPLHSGKERDQLDALW
ncbi:BatD family protein [Agaribacterium sp. ZY112]|uniref:BatD family protein n=1 Tax=Agaribacterium sp. ZY112 TaxID=3233574 RepID=UPI003526038A